MHIAQTRDWTMERIVRLMAGTFVIAGTLLGTLASPYWLLLPGMVGVNLFIFTLTGFCPMAVALHAAGVGEEDY